MLELIHANEGVVTAIATAVIAVFTFTLWLTGRNQLRHTREIERAYLTGGGDYLRDLNNAIVVRNGKRFFLVHVANYGKTPAFLADFDVHFAKLDDLKPEAQARPVSRSRRHHDRLAPGGHTKAIKDIEIPDGVDIVYGAFWYQDIWRRKDHEFRFILRLGSTQTWTDVTGVHEDYWDWD